MERLIDKFKEVELPYKYVDVPFENGESSRHEYLRFYVNKVVTNLTRHGFKKAGFKEIKDSDKWNTSWGRQYQSIEYRRCKEWQKINHFAGAFHVGRKDNLHKRMSELRSRSKELSRFYPTSFLIPEEKEELSKVWTSFPAWIIKPIASSRGRGIRIVKSTEKVPNEEAVVQEYLDKPYLISGRKFDIRVYALVSCCDPIRIYIHSAGLARFCSHVYDPNNYADEKCHITNFALNKDDEEFKRSDGEESIESSKWSLEFFKNYLENNGIDVEKVMRDIEEVTISTIIAGFQQIRPYHSTHVRHRHTSYEMYGLDIMFDENMEPHLIEINISPSMSGQDSKLDQSIKFPLQLDLLHMARIIDCNPNLPNPCPGIAAIDKLWHDSAVGDRARSVINGSVNGWDEPTFGDITMIRDFAEEIPRTRGFRLVYPLPENIDKYRDAYKKLTYRDVMFHAFIKLSDDEKYNVIEKNWNDYSEKMSDIRQFHEATLANGGTTPGEYKHIFSLSVPKEGGPPGGDTGEVVNAVSIKNRSLLDANDSDPNDRQVEDALANELPQQGEQPVDDGAQQEGQSAGEQTQNDGQLADDPVIREDLAADEPREDVPTVQDGSDAGMSAEHGEAPFVGGAPGEKTDDPVDGAAN